MRPSIMRCSIIIAFVASLAVAQRPGGGQGGRQGSRQDGSGPPNSTEVGASIYPDGASGGGGTGTGPTSPNTDPAIAADLGTTETTDTSSINPNAATGGGGGGGTGTGTGTTDVIVPPEAAADLGTTGTTDTITGTTPPNADPDPAAEDDIAENPTGTTTSSGGSGGSLKASFTAYGGGDSNDSGTCNKRMACGTWNNPGYNAAINEAYYDNGAACGTCYRATYGGTSIVVKVNNLCPINGNEEWCGQSSKSATNQHGATIHLDLCMDNGSAAALFGGNTGSGEGTAESVSCSEWTGSADQGAAWKRSEALAILSGKRF